MEDLGKDHEDLLEEEVLARESDVAVSIGPFQGELECQQETELHPCVLTVTDQAP